MPKFLLWWCLFSLSASGVCANDAVHHFVSSPITKNATISLLVRNITQQANVAEFRSNSATPPASIVKLITTATALEMLGPTFRFETYIETDGTIDGNGTLHGNLYIRGTGDPTTGSYKIGDQNFLQRWVMEMRKAGIKKINGKVIGDASFFDAEALNPQWIWEDIGNYYAPGIFALSYLDNTMNVQLMSGANGTKVQILKTTPTIEGIHFENNLMCTNAVTTRDVYVRGLPYSNTRYLYGSVLPNQGVFGVRGDIPNPPLLLAQHFTRRLREGGIFTTEEANYQTAYQPTNNRVVLYTHYSPPLTEIITEINFKSNNHYAEQLFRYLGTLVAKPGSIANSIQTIKTFWKNRFVSVEGAFICDGSGLALQNAISADTFIDLLLYMSEKSLYSEAFLASLPKSGMEGTLTSFLRDTHLHGAVQAKSGTTSRIKSFAGFAKGKSGDEYVFAVIVNNGAARARIVQREIEKFLLDVCK